MFELLFLVFATVVLPILVNKTTEKGRFDWIHPHLRWLWTVVFAFVSLYLLEKPMLREATMRTKESLDHASPVWGYIFCGIVGASLLCGYWWFAGKIIPSEVSHHPALSKGSNGTDSHSAQHIRELEPIVIDDVFSTMIPYSTVENRVPTYNPFLKKDDSGRPELDDTASRYNKLGHFVNQWLDAKDKGNETSVEDIEILLAEALQFYIVEEIDYLQSSTFQIEMTDGVGAAASSSLGVSPPDAVLYPSAKFIQVLAANRIAASYGGVKWSVREYKVPKSTNIIVENRTTQAPSKFIFALRNPSLYVLEISIMSTGGAGLPPRGYKFLNGVDLRHITTYSFVVRGHFKFKRTVDTDSVRQDGYTRWASGIFAGLKDDLTK